MRCGSPRRCARRPASLPRALLSLACAAALQGWDKTFCLPFLKADGFEEIHFFGDKTAEGGNDFEIFSSPLTIGHTTTGPEDTAKQCHALFLA